MEPRPGTVTQYLQALRRGDAGVWNELFECVHGELRQLAHLHMGRERMDHVLQTTALVNEAYLRLVGRRLERVEDHAQFLRVVASCNVSPELAV